MIFTRQKIDIYMICKESVDILNTFLLKYPCIQIIVVILLVFLKYLASKKNIVINIILNV